MALTLPTVLLFLLTLTTALVTPRNTPLIQADLVTVNNNTIAWRTSLEQWDGRASTGITGPYQLERKLETSVNTTTSNLTANPALSAADANNLLTYTNKTVEPSLRAALAALELRKPYATSSGLLNIFRTELNTLRNTFVALGNAFRAKVPSSLTSQSTAVFQRIDADFAQAVAYYAS